MSIYDSRAFVKRLTAAGMPEGQADTLANENLLLLAEHLATKDDIELFRKEVRAELASIRSELVSMRAELGANRAEMGALENRLLVKLDGLMAAMLTLFRLL